VPLRRGLRWWRLLCADWRYAVPSRLARPLSQTRGSGCSCLISNTCRLSHRSSGHGLCEGTVCICAPGYAGDECALFSPCHNNCSGRGLCVDSRCTCAHGYGGPAGDCALRVEVSSTQCVHDCGGRGVCKGDSCVCVPGWSGPDCSISAPCSGACSSHGICSGGRCHCAPGFQGEACERPMADAPSRGNAPDAVSATHRRHLGQRPAASVPSSRDEGNPTCACSQS
jgi:hypothetical protein